MKKLFRSYPVYLLIFPVYLAASAGYIWFTSLTHDDGIIPASEQIIEIRPDGSERLLQEIKTVEPGSAADRVGIRAGDKVIAYNGISVSELFTLPENRNDAVRQMKEVKSRIFKRGEPTSYLIKRGKKKMSFLVPYTPVGLTGLDQAVFLRFFSGLVLAALALFIFIQRPGLKTVRIFYVYAILDALYRSISVYNPLWNIEAVYFFNIAGPLFEFLANMSFLHFTLYYPTKRREYRPLLWVLYITGLAVTLLYIYGFSTLSIPVEIPYWMRKVYKTLLFAGGFSILTYKYIFPAGGNERYKVQWLLAALTVYTVSILALGYIPSYMEFGDFSYFSQEAQFITSVIFLLIPLAFLFTVVRYRLFDLNTLLIRTVTYVLLTGTLFLVYLGVLQLFNRVLQPYLPMDSDWTSFISLVLVVLLFNPFHFRIQTMLDRAFYREHLSDFDTLKKLSDEIFIKTDEENIIFDVTNSLVNVMQVSQVALYRRNDEEGHYYCRHLCHHRDFDDSSGGRFEPLSLNSPMAIMIEQEKLAMYIDDESLSIFSGLGEGYETIRDMQSEVIIPLSTGPDSRGEGFVVISSRMNGKPLLVREIELVRTVARGASLALQNADLVKKAREQQRIESEVHLARSVQSTLAPDKLPEIEGLEIATYCRTAREIGGDFYEFFPADNGNLELVLGDVSGKGVSAGMVAAMSAGMCMARSHDSLDAANVLTHLNSTMIDANIQKHNVAMVYCIYNRQNGLINISNGGIPYPLLIRNGKVQIVKIGGLPLSSLPDYRYRSVEMQLQPGDYLLLYSDGIIETMDRNREIMSIDGLIAYIEKNHFSGADGLLDLVLRCQAEFTATPDDLEDDSTVVVLKLKD